MDSLDKFLNKKEYNKRLVLSSRLHTKIVKRTSKQLVKNPTLLKTLVDFYDSLNLLVQKVL